MDGGAGGSEHAACPGGTEVAFIEPSKCASTEPGRHRAGRDTRFIPKPSQQEDCGPIAGMNAYAIQEKDALFFSGRVFLECPLVSCPSETIVQGLEQDSGGSCPVSSGAEPSADPCV